MTKTIKIGNTDYVAVSKSSSNRGKRRYSPKRDSSLFFKSPAQKAYESRKHLETIRNKRQIGLHEEEYRKEQAIRRKALKQRRKEARARFVQNTKNFYNKNSETISKGTSAGKSIFGRLKRKKKEQPKALPYRPYSYGGFESARTENTQ